MWSPLLSLVQIKCGDDVFCSAMTIIFTLVTVSQILFPFFCWCLASCVLIEAYNRCMSRIRELWLSIYFIFFIYLLRVVSLSRKNAFFSHIALLSFFVGTIRSHTMVCSITNFTNWQVAAWFCFFQIFVCLSPLECFSSTTISIWLAFATVILVELCMIIPLYSNCCFSRIFANLSTQANYDSNFVKCKYFFCNGKIGRMLNWDASRRFPAYHPYET
mgnify:CR=1 FL=1